MYKCSRYICWLPKEPMFGVTEADMGGHRRVFKRTVIYTDVSTREIQSHVIVQGTTNNPSIDLPTEFHF